MLKYKYVQRENLLPVLLKILSLFIVSFVYKQQARLD